MNDEFNFAEVTTVADDFAAHKGEYDVLMENALKDLTNAIKNIKSGRDASALSNDIAALMKEHGAKFGKALGSAKKEEREKWAPELSGILTKAIDMEPENIESVVRGAYQIEKAYEGADSGIFSSVVDKAMFRHRSKTNKIMAVVDESFQDYEKQPHQDVATNRTFGKIYGSAFGKTGKKAYADKANEIFEKNEFLKGNITVEKLFKRLQENPTSEAAQDDFEKKLNMLLDTDKVEPMNAVLDYRKAMTKIEDPAARETIYTIVLSAVDEHIKFPVMKCSTMFEMLDTIFKEEKDLTVRKSVTALAVNSARKGMVSESGGLTIQAGMEKKTLNVLKKMASTYGDYDGLKDLVVNTAANYKNSPEVMKDLRECMMRVFDYVLKPVEQATGQPYALDPQKCSDFENSVFKERRERNLSAKIYTLLNIPSVELGVKRDTDKTYYPSKEEMTKVVNLLSQYSTINYNVALDIVGKFDQEKFTNIDDSILEKLSNRARERMEKSDFKMFDDRHLTPLRSALHKHGIEKKKQQKDNAPKQWHEKTEAKKEPKPTQISISFSPKDLDGTMEK